MHLERDDSALGGCVGIVVGDLTHQHAVDIQRDLGTVTDDPILVPILFLEVLQKLAGISDFLNSFLPSAAIVTFSPRAPISPRL